MAERQQPRAGTWLWDAAWPQEQRMLTGEKWAAGIAEARRRLQQDLSGTGLTLVGLPVIEAAREDGNIRLSWKVFSGPFPTEELDRA